MFPSKNIPEGYPSTLFERFQERLQLKKARSSHFSTSIVHFNLFITLIVQKCRNRTILKEYIFDVALVFSFLVGMLELNDICSRIC